MFKERKPVRKNVKNLRSLISSIYKKINKLDHNNFRDISVTSTMDYMQNSVRSY